MEAAAQSRVQCTTVQPRSDAHVFNSVGHPLANNWPTNHMIQYIQAVDLIQRVDAFTGMQLCAGRCCRRWQRGAER